MKRVLICAAAVMCGAIAFAQNWSEVEQTGTGNNATVGQTGANTSTVLQKGKAWDNPPEGGQNNKAYVNQIGAPRPLLLTRAGIEIARQYYRLGRKMIQR